MGSIPFRRKNEFQSVEDFTAFLDALGDAAHADTPQSQQESLGKKLSIVAQAAGALLIAPLCITERLADEIKDRFIDSPRSGFGRMTVAQIREYCTHNEGGLTVDITSSWRHRSR